MNKHITLKKFIIFTVTFLFLFSIMPRYFANEGPLSDISQIEIFINNFFLTRNTSFIEGDISNLINNYNLNQNNAKYALDHEVRRIKYLRDWSSERGIQLTNIKSIAHLKNFSPGSTHSSLRVDEEFIVEYIYNSDNAKKLNTFGISLFHFMNLSKNNNHYVISKDWYLDCFEDALKSYTGNFSNAILPSPKDKCHDISLLIRCTEDNILDSSPIGYDRASSIAYADKYCGVTHFSKNQEKYPRKYPNYSGIGGNCTNYVSQCLGDAEGGKLKQDYAWCSTLKKGKSDSSTSWINADAFKNYILYNGKGSIIRHGDFRHIISLGENEKKHLFSKLKIGDIVSYSKKGDIDHNAIITSFDSYGYPLINSHTVDRYHVPFDLGWGDNGISFYMIHLK